MSGWKTATIVTDRETEKELNMKINHHDKEEENFKKLSDNSFGMGGYEAEIQDKIADLIQETDVGKGDQVLIIEANDTTDSGIGTLYEVKQETENKGVKLEKKDSKRGYEGAMARDVTGYFREHHDINGYARIY